MKKTKAGPAQAVEVFTIKLPADVARRVRFVAAEEDSQPESFIAAAAVSWLVASLEDTRDDEEEMTKRSVAANRGALELEGVK